MSDELSGVSQDILPGGQSVIADVGAPDSFTALMAVPVSKLDADQYSAEDLHGVTESLFGSGNLNFLLLQNSQTNDALAALTSSPLSGTAANILSSGAGVAFAPGASANAGGSSDLTGGKFSIASDRTTDRHGEGSFDFHAAEGSVTSAIAGTAAAIAPPAAHAALSAGPEGFGGGGVSAAGTQSHNGDDGSTVAGQNGLDGGNGANGSSGHNGADGAKGVNGSNGDGGHGHDGGDTTVNIDVNVNAGGLTNTVTNVLNNTANTITNVLHTLDVTHLVSDMTNTVHHITHDVVDSVTHAADNLLLPVVHDTVPLATTTLTDVGGLLGHVDAGGIANKITGTAGNLLTDMLGGDTHGNGLLSGLGLNLNAGTALGNISDINLGVAVGSNVTTALHAAVELTPVLDLAGGLGHAVSGIVAPVLDGLSGHAGSGGADLIVNSSGALGRLDLPGVHVDVPLPAPVAALTGSVDVNTALDILHDAGNPVSAAVSVSSDLTGDLTAVHTGLPVASVVSDATNVVTALTDGLPDLGHNGSAPVASVTADVTADLGSLTGGIHDAGIASDPGATAADVTSTITAPVADLTAPVSASLTDISHDSSSISGLTPVIDSVANVTADLATTIADSGHDTGITSDPGAALADVTGDITAGGGVAPVADLTAAISASLTDTGHDGNVAGSIDQSNSVAANVTGDLTGLITTSDSNSADLLGNLLGGQGQDAGAGVTVDANASIADMAPAETHTADPLTAITDIVTGTADTTVDTAINLLSNGSVSSGGSTDILGSLTSGTAGADNASATVTWPESTVTDTTHVMATADTGGLGGVLPTPVGSVAEGLSSVLGDHSASSSHHHGIL